MMSNTKEQNTAITTIDSNLAVNAGAGTGKTKVLTERYVYILENGDLEENKEVESIVAITFTKKATQEMKERIREEIKSRFPLDNKWRRFYNDMEKSNISTIHSFCGNILRDNALNLNIDPMFKVMDDNEGDLLLEETILDLLLKGIEEDENMYNFVKSFKRDDLSKAVYELKSIYYKVRTVGYSLENVKDMTLSYINSIEVDDEDIEEIKNTFEYLAGKSRKNSKIAKLLQNDIWLKFYEGNYSDEELVSILKHLYENIGTNKKEADIINNLKALVNKTLLIEEKEYTWLYETFLELLIDIDREYGIRKDEIGVLDYDDLQILVLKLFEDESVRKEYQNKYRYIMVDEFQDTNELQKKIFYKLCSDTSLLDRNNLFIVGDPKQSIYGFRGADLDVFYNVVDDIENISGQKAINLDKNFRTVNTILNFVNDLFSNLMGSKYISLLNHHKSDNQIDVEIIEKKDVEIPPNVEKSEYNAYLEGKLIAGRIKELVDEGTFGYKDFCLLFRASTLDYIYEDVLKQYGIPYYNVGGKGLFEGQEIKDLVNGLKAISNRYDIISTIGFLRSPMIGISDKTLYWLLKYKKDNLLMTMSHDIPHIDEEEMEKLEKAKTILNQFMIKKDLYGVARLLKELIDQTYYLECLMLVPGGKQLASNVHKFIDMCLEYDKNSIGSLEDFIDYIEEMKSSEESKAKIYSEDANVVKLMTIHKSKGLQFPVVIIPQMAKRSRNDYSFAAFHKDKGIGLKHEGFAPFHVNIRKDLNENEKEEDKRILYVAMTRAEKRLILGNQGDNRGFKKMIGDLIDLKSVTYIDKVASEPIATEGVKIIEDKLLQSKPFDRKNIPLIQEISGYNKKVFSSFNASQFMDFNECRRKFYMKYYRKMPLNGFELNPSETENNIVLLDGASKGNIIHRFCQHYKLGLDYNKLLKQSVNSFGFEYNDDVERELRHYVMNYLKYYNEDYDEAFSEKEFYCSIGDSYVRGTIDRVVIKNGKCEIYDFKTNKVYNKNNLKKKYSSQLQLYVNAFKRITGMEVSKAAIVFLDTGDIEEIDISESSLNSNLKSVKDFIHFVNNNSSIKEYERSSNCKIKCEYGIMCK